MTPRERQVYDFVCAHWAEHKSGPTFREIAEAIGLKSHTQGHDIAWRMADLGWLRITEGKQRGISPTGKCPCCGRGEATERAMIGRAILQADRGLKP